VAQLELTSEFQLMKPIASLYEGKLQG